MFALIGNHWGFPSYACSNPLAAVAALLFSQPLKGCDVRLCERESHRPSVFIGCYALRHDAPTAFYVILFTGGFALKTAFAQRPVGL